MYGVIRVGGWQNKNFQTICFWSYLIGKGYFSCVEHKFPEPGHSYLDSDRDFGHIESCVKRRENIYAVNEYINIMMRSTNKPKPVVTQMGDKMFDVASLQQLLGLNNSDRNTDGEKIQLTDKVKVVRVDHFGF